MNKHAIRRGVAGLLAALTLLQGAALTALAAENQEPSVQAVTMAEPQLRSGTAVIPSDATPEQVKELLCEALVANADQVDAQSLNWEYYCTGKNGLLTNDAWGSVNGFASEKKVVFVTTTYTHPALAANEDGDYQVRLANTDTVVTLTKSAKQSSSITLNEGCSVALPYNEDATVNYDALRQNIFSAVVASTTPVLSMNDVAIEYYAENVVAGRPAGTHAWMPLEGGKSDIRTFPPISVGEHQIRISYAGTDSIYGSSEETTVTITERPAAPYTLKEIPEAVTLVVGEDMKVDYAALEDTIFNAVVASSEVLTKDNVSVTYEAKLVTSLDAKYVPLNGEGLYPAISAGDQKVRISWPGSQQYAPTTIEKTITVKDREQVQFNLNDGPYEVGMKFTDDQGYDYDATAAAIYNAVVASTVNPEGLTASDVTVEYNVDKTGITDTFKPLNETDLTGLVKFGTGTWEIRISWAGNQQYRGNSVTVDVTTTDNRIASSVALHTGVSFTYNMDPAVMKQAIFDSVIDWTNSTLPAKETLELDDFVIEYKAKLTDAETGVDVDLSDLEGILGQIPGLDDLISSDKLTQWVPLEGKEYKIGDTVLGAFPQIGAGENQQICVSFKGNADYRPSETTEGTVTVNKAKVSVKVNSTNMYADEALPENFITTDPADKFDLYTIYAGVTSNVTTGIYLDLPDRYTAEGSLLLKLIDQALETVGQKTLTQMLNEGITVGELRQLLSTQQLLELLDKLNIDTGTFGQILEAVNKLPGILDSVRVSFGTPNRAGLYTVVAVTDNQNYETGVGIGFLLVKMRLSGSKLTWNQEIPGGKLTAAQAKEFDFGATLSYNGDVTVSQSGVKYLYSGFTSKWRVYSSTTTPPTEPGRYVVTVCIIGGNYMAAPITRSFQITK